MTIQEKHKKILSRFVPHRDYSLTDYYGVAYMKIKKNNHHQLKLIHDYKGGNMKLSSGIVFESFETCMKVLSILEQFNTTKREKTEDEELGSLLD